MHLKLFFIRKIKALFVRFRLHVLLGIFDGFLLNLVYLSKLSRWISSTTKGSFNDFYNRKVIYTDRFKLHEFILNDEIKAAPIEYLEFGVADGVAFKWWVDKIKNRQSKFFGFDVFTGLPEDFGVMKQHHYNMKGKTPDIQDDRVSFISGLFQESLPEFLNNYETNLRKVIHMDADLYSSTLFVLTQLIPFLRKGDIIIFDEFGVPTHEFRAFNDVISAYKLDFKFLGAVNNYLQIAIKIK